MCEKTDIKYFLHRHTITGIHVYKYFNAVFVHKCDIDYLRLWPRTMISMAEKCNKNVKKLEFYTLFVHCLSSIFMAGLKQVFQFVCTCGTEFHNSVFVFLTCLRLLKKVYKFW